MTMTWLSGMPAAVAIAPKDRPTTTAAAHRAPTSRTIGSAVNAVRDIERIVRYAERIPCVRQAECIVRYAEREPYGRATGVHRRRTAPRAGPREAVPERGREAGRHRQVDPPP